MQGMSLVELLVGVAVGLFIVAAAALMTSNQLVDNRRLLIETQLQQDLRATADMVTRDLRRAGYWQNASLGVPAPTSVSGPISVVDNPYDKLVVPAPEDTSPPYVMYSYRRGSGSESFGFRLNNGVLQACQSDYQATGCTGTWQDLSDGNTMELTAFTITEVRAGLREKTDNTKASRVTCPNFCPADPTGATAASTSCWPAVRQREFAVTFTGKSRSDPTFVRTLSTSMRIRNLSVDLDASIPSGAACPAPT
jgi:type IV pilus assembly protein PilW